MAGGYSRTRQNRCPAGTAGDRVVVPAAQTVVLTDELRGGDEQTLSFSTRWRRSPMIVRVRYRDGGWVVHADDQDTPSSEHATANAAAHAAIAYAAARHDEACVVIHDRYERVHFLPGRISSLERPAVAASA
jgi:hypothetical protein